MVNRTENDKFHLFRLIKLLRIPRVVALLDVEKWKSHMKSYYQNQLDHSVIIDNYIYHYPIWKQIKQVHAYRVFQTIVIIYSVSYFLAIFYRIFVFDLVDWRNENRDHDVAWSPDVYWGHQTFYKFKEYGFSDDD